MYRFDFSLNRTISKEELQQIEQRVNEVIRCVVGCLRTQLLTFAHCSLYCFSAKLVVRSDVVPLQQAMSIPGLRAVFGEAYPDPVRVVSMQPKVRLSIGCSVLCQPECSKWHHRQQ
jgi:alanyl-tRNA synthetase